MVERKKNIWLKQLQKKKKNNIVVSNGDAQVWIYIYGSKLNENKSNHKEKNSHKYFVIRGTHYKRCPKLQYEEW